MCGYGPKDRHKGAYRADPSAFTSLPYGHDHRVQPLLWAAYQLPAFMVASAFRRFRL